MPRKAQSTPEQEEKKEAVNAPADEKQEQEKGTEAHTEGCCIPRGNSRAGGKERG